MSIGKAPPPALWSKPDDSRGKDGPKINWTDPGLSSSDRVKLFMQNYRTGVASAGSALVSTFSTHPLDSIKTRMQGYNMPSLVECLRESRRSDGLMGLWRGVVPPLVSHTGVRSLSMTIYQRAKYKVSGYMERVTGVSALDHCNTMGARPNIHTMTCFGTAGMFTGFCVSFVACPFELTKVGRQLSGVTHLQTGLSSSDVELGRRLNEAGTIGAVRDLYKRRGLAGMYSGIGLHVVRDTIGTGIFFMSYETLKQLLANSRGRRPDSPFAGAMSGLVCGMVSWISVYPLDTIKTEYQRKCLFMQDGHNEKISRINWFSRSQYRGLSISLTRSALVNMIMMMSFEWIKKRIRAFDVDAVKSRDALLD